MPSGEITVLLDRMHGGDAAARDALLPLVYNELEAIARAYVNPAASLEPRGLVHELYLKLVTSPVVARDRKHFYAIAALPGLADDDRNVDVLAIDDALTKLEAQSPRQARIVELRCLWGCL